MTLIAPRKTTPSHRFPIISEPVVNVADWKLQSGKKSGLTVFSPVRMLQNGSTTRARQVLSIGTPDAFPP